MLRLRSCFDCAANDMDYNAYNSLFKKSLRPYMAHIQRIETTQGDALCY